MRARVVLAAQWGVALGAGVAFHVYVGNAGVVQGASLFRLRLCFITACAGASMLPTFRACCNVVWFDQFSVGRWGTPVRRGEVVAATVQNEANGLPSGVVKRVAAVAGDYVVNEVTGQVLRVPPSNVWLLGDNPSESHDSRHYGPVHVNRIRARVRVWCVCVCWRAPDVRVPQVSYILWPWPSRVSTEPRPPTQAHMDASAALSAQFV